MARDAAATPSFISPITVVLCLESSYIFWCKASEPCLTTSRKGIKPHARGLFVNAKCSTASLRSATRDSEYPQIEGPDKLTIIVVRLKIMSVMPLRPICMSSWTTRSSALSKSATLLSCYITTSAFPTI